MNSRGPSPKCTLRSEKSALTGCFRYRTFESRPLDLDWRASHQATNPPHTTTANSTLTCGSPGRVIHTSQAGICTAAIMTSGGGGEIARVPIAHRHTEHGLGQWYHSAPMGDDLPQAKPARMRLDLLMVERGLCVSRTRAQALIIAGKVVVGDHTHTKPGTKVRDNIGIRLRGQDHAFASRGGLKLKGALEHFNVELRDRVAMDVGASTGGFTDCLLQAGVAKVFAIDVGYGQLAWKLAQDPRVVSLERQNIRHLDPARLGEPIELTVIDCSFISLTKVLPCLPPFLGPGADVVALIKPQFEVGKAQVHKGGIVRDPAAREQACQAVAQAAQDLGFVVRGECESPITGREGNHEFFVWLGWPGPEQAFFGAPL
ncbi:MAG: TlyA family RNA methyltransferase [Nannocystaceae bacterium]